MSRDLRSSEAARPAADGTGASIAIVCSRFNDAIVENLVSGARRALVEHGVHEAAIDTFWVPGALEIPQVARAIAEAGRHDAIIALGAVIKGDTYHFEVVCDASAAGLMQLSISTGVDRLRQVGCGRLVGGSAVAAPIRSRSAALENWSVENGSTT
jgi:6,7-dimethyl-8-ribityllumazine synthase